MFVVDTFDKGDILSGPGFEHHVVSVGGHRVEPSQLKDRRAVLFIVPTNDVVALFLHNRGEHGPGQDGFGHRLVGFDGNCFDLCCGGVLSITGNQGLQCLKELFIDGPLEVPQLYRVLELQPLRYPRAPNW